MLDDLTIDMIADGVQMVRRWRNNQLVSAVNGEISIYNLEDLVRLVGNLNAAYEHICSAKATDDPSRAMFCVYKHLSTALVQSEEVDGNNTAIYDILSIMSGGKITACSACDDDSAASSEQDDLSVPFDFPEEMLELEDNTKGEWS